MSVDWAHGRGHKLREKHPDRTAPGRARSAGAAENRVGLSHPQLRTGTINARGRVPVLDRSAGAAARKDPALGTPLAGGWAKEACAGEKRLSKTGYDVFGGACVDFLDAGLASTLGAAGIYACAGLRSRPSHGKRHLGGPSNGGRLTGTALIERTAREGDLSRAARGRGASRCPRTGGNGGSACTARSRAGRSSTCKACPGRGAFTAPAGRALSGGADDLAWPKRRGTGRTLAT